MKIAVWDLPTRLFHWALVALVIAAFVTVNLGGTAMVWHGRIGLAILGLLVFRIVWGFAGSTYARFSQFVRGPAIIRRYLQGKWQGQGHNPLGALSVLALLGTLSLQAATGLFANDDIAYDGYLAVLISTDLSNRITGIHHLLEKLLLLLVAAHVGAIAYYARVKKHNLVVPMVTGKAEGRPEEAAKGGSLAGLLAGVFLACLAIYAAGGGFNPPPPPAPVEKAPDF